MSIQQLRPFPSHFPLKDLTVITGTALEFKLNPHMAEVASKMRTWFEKQDMDEEAKKRHLAAEFELCAGMAFSDAEATRLEICLAWLLWSFCLDDVTDSGEMQSNPDAILSVTERYKELLEDPDGVAVKAEGDAPFAGMFDIIRKRIKANGIAGVYHSARRRMLCVLPR